MKILIKYASRGRKDQYFDGLDNILSNIHTDDYLILSSFDEDDTVMNNEEVRERLDKYDKLIYYYGPGISKVHAINRDIDKIDYQWEMLINFSDDMRFIKQGWDEIMIEEIRKVFGDSTDFFAHFWDGSTPHNTPLPTMSVIGREYYERDMYIYHPLYKSILCDAEAYHVAQMRERWHYFEFKKRDEKYGNILKEESLFVHNHPAWGKAKDDQVYELNKKFSHEDEVLYYKRLNKYFYVNNPKDHTIYFKHAIK